jgi:HAD superfamily phosphatase (TIGR01681 family)
VALNPDSKRNRPDYSQGKFKSFEDLLRYSYEKTPCEASPDECTPRRIRHVIWDADDTIWQIQPYGIASYCNPPFEKVNERQLKATCDVLMYRKTDGIEVERQKTEGGVVLSPKFIETLDKLAAKGIGSSIASNNNPGSVERLLEAFDIKAKFTVIESNWKTKSDQVRDISAKTGIPGKEIIYVDDNIANAVDVKLDLGALSIAMGHDIITPDEVLQFIKEA